MRKALKYKWWEGRSQLSSEMQLSSSGEGSKVKGTRLQEQNRSQKQQQKIIGRRHEDTCTNTRSMESKQEEFIVLCEFTELQHCWHNWDMASQPACLEHCSGWTKALHKSNGGKRRREAALSVKAWLECMELWYRAGDRLAESLWLRIPGKAGRDDDVVGACYRPPDQGKEGGKGFSNSSRKSLTHRFWRIWGNFWHLLGRQHSS